MPVDSGDQAAIGEKDARHLSRVRGGPGYTGNPYHARHESPDPDFGTKQLPPCTFIQAEGSVQSEVRIADAIHIGKAVGVNPLLDARPVAHVNQQDPRTCAVDFLSGPSAVENAHYLGGVPAAGM